MRNGINVAAVSELVHELRHATGENEIHYAVDLQWIGGLTMALNTRALTFGSKRIARDFRFKADHHTNPHPAAAPSPADLFLCGVGACVANILVQGASYKEIDITSLQVQTSAQVATDLHPTEGIKNGTVTVKLVANGSHWQYQQMMMNVSRFSPNYVTATRKNSIQLSYTHEAISLREGPLFSGHPSTVTSSHQPPVNSDCLYTGINIKWKNGTQFDVDLLARQWQEQSWPLDASFSVDEPNAALGLNQAPNPQEYIIGAVAADIAQHLVLIAKENGHSLSGLSATISCKLDMQACYNIFDNSVVQLQDTVLKIYAMSQYSEAEMQEFIQLACQRSSCWQSFVNPCRIHLDRESL
ncbi:MAG: putative OsmC-like protein [Candidatus Endobugula sp.]